MTEFESVLWSSFLAGFVIVLMFDFIGRLLSLMQRDGAGIWRPPG